MVLDNQLLITILTLIAGGSGIGGIIISLSTKKKSKAEASKIIEEAAGQLVERYRDHNNSLIQECVGLKSNTEELRREIETLKGRVDENDACQTTLKRQIMDLEIEKRSLTIKIQRLQEQVKALEEENERLRELKNS
jgi:FtsZ-binding cell division protein ZapB